MNEIGLDTLIENLTRAVYQHAAHNSVINQNAVARAQNAIVEFVETLAAATPDPRAGLRRCEVRKLGPSAGGGWFHDWSGLNDHPKAIVEHDNGQVYTWNAEDVRFTDIPEKPQ